MRGRALTDEQKRAVLDRVYAAWTASPDSRLQRLDQLIDNAVFAANECFFYIEDDALADLVAKFTDPTKD